MAQEAIHIVLKQHITDLILSTLGGGFEINSIILVGSNHNIEGLASEALKESDIDVIVLADSGPFQINRSYKGIQFDVNVINENDIISLLLSGLQSINTAGKIFSSIEPNNIIRDEKGLGALFVEVVKELYAILIKASIPNFYANSIFLHNINANLKDYNNKSSVESLFAFGRLSNHVFDHIANLIYPFSITGSYRGKVFEEYLKDIFENITKQGKKGAVVDDKLIENCVNRFSPNLEYAYEAIEHSEVLEKEILSGNIKTFYFGYDNILLEKEIVFLDQREFQYSSDQKRYKLSNCNNIIPCLSKKDLKLYTDFLVYLSTHYFSNSLKERKEVFQGIATLFSGWGAENVVNQSFKAIILMKFTFEFSQNKYKIGLLDFKDWLDTLSISFFSKKWTKPPVAYINEKTLALLQCIDDSISDKEKEIKTCYIFFGIMKSLRITVDDLDF